MLDPLADGVSFTLVVEIFEPGGKTPPNTHAVAEEAFFVMAAPAGLLLMN
jgi:quercetin dioxygenase-like cupin family protein